ncbi:MAG: hypothetical protein KIS66_13005 [Fimbriimonadaceae bacterium]|nr:hypothetical protein [Fimbriimonadaceae bacterium]
MFLSVMASAFALSLAGGGGPLTGSYSIAYLGGSGSITARMDRFVGETQTTKTNEPWFDSPYWSVSTPQGKIVSYKVKEEHTRKWNQPGTLETQMCATFQSSPGIAFAFRSWITASGGEPPENGLIVRLNYTPYLQAHILSQDIEAQGVASARVSTGKKPDVFSGNVSRPPAGQDEGGSFEDTLPTSQFPSFSVPYPVPNGEWEQAGSNYTKDVFLPMIPVLARAKYDVNNTGGNSTVLNIFGEAQVTLDSATFEQGPNKIAASANVFPREPAFVEVRNTGGSLLDSFHVILDESGGFTVPMGSLADGTYRIYLSSIGTLRKRTDVVYTSAGVTGVSITLVRGDLDGDNDVDGDDLETITAWDGKTSSSPGWRTPNALGYAPYDADLDRDGDVDDDDYDIAYVNNGVDGDA